MKNKRKSPRLYLLLTFIYFLNAVIWIWLGLIPRNYSDLKLVIGILWFVGALTALSKFRKTRRLTQIAEN